MYKMNLPIMKLKDTPEWSSRQNFWPPEIGFCFNYSFSALDTYQGVPSNDPVTPTSVHCGDSGLNKTVDESTGQQCLEHWSGIFHIWYKSLTETVTGS